MKKVSEDVSIDLIRNIEAYQNKSTRQNQREANRLISYLPASPTEQSFAKVYPALAAEWNFRKNHPITPRMLHPKSNREVWWKCAAGHEWEASITNRVAGKGCPYCSGRLASDANNLAAKHPAIARQWHPTKNGDRMPEQFTPHSNQTVWWLCPKGHEYDMKIYRRTSGDRCPMCSGRYATTKHNLAVRYPKIAALWHPTKNGQLRPTDITPRSNKRIWLLCPKGHEWDTTASNAATLKKCPYCLGKRICLENSLASEEPALAAEWHPTKNTIKPSEVRPNSNRKVWWVCKKGHEWEVTVSHRTYGRGCPKCRDESRTEIAKKAWVTRRARLNRR